MKKLLLLASLTTGGLARADGSVEPMNPTDAVNPTSVVQGAGIKVGEGTVLHPTFGVETGVVSNVFYEEQEANVAGLLRILFEIQTGSLPGERGGIKNQDATSVAEQNQERGALQYLASGYLSWDQYLSTNDAVTSQGGLGGGLLLNGIFNPQKTLSISFLENYERVIRSTNFESELDTNRDVNSLTLRFNVQPHGRTLGGYLYYRNLIDYFEHDEQRFANRFNNTFGARLNYQWLPLTRVYADASIGVFTGLGTASTKIDSYPLQAVAGIMTALTLNLTLNTRIGYTQGFYSGGPDYATVTGGVQLGYRYSPMGRMTLMYSYDHQDSINANFFRDHLVKFGVDQQFVPFAASASAELHLREYQGIQDVTGIMGNSAVRDDVIAAANVGVRYIYRGWAAATVDYKFSTVSTDFRYDTGGGFLDDPSYYRHELLAGFRAAY